MPSRIEDYALIGDCHTGALVARDGSIDWLCLPRFDSPACFAALLGSDANGRWKIAPSGEIRAIKRSYRGGTLILETEFETDSGAATIVDFMPPRSGPIDVVRVVQGRRGQVPMHMDLVIRFDYGSIVPWVRQIQRGIRATAGPDTVHVRSPIPMHGENFHTVADFTVSAGQSLPFTITWSATHHGEPEAHIWHRSLEETDQWWSSWAARCTYRGDHREAVLRSLLTLKAMTYLPTGGLVAAVTTSLPERLGGVRNWDYRYCWARDAAFTLDALMSAGYHEEAKAWREWLVRAVAGTPSQLQIMYGLRGERRLPELELDWLSGYEMSAPVRIGNAAYRQHQLDIYGEIMHALYVARRSGLPFDEDSWRVQRSIMESLQTAWREPDEGIWEVRGLRRHFTHSKVMAWVAADRAVRAVEEFGASGDAEKWRSLRDCIHAEVCERGFDASKNSFVQSYGSHDPDASLLVMPLVGFLPASDPRMIGTVESIRRELMENGFVYRYITKESVDGLPRGEGAFLLCSFWMVDNLALQGRTGEARELLAALMSLRNDVGLLPEQFDAGARRFLGNFPQAFSHVGLIHSVLQLQSSARGAVLR